MFPTRYDRVNTLSVSRNGLLIGLPKVQLTFSEQDFAVDPVLLTTLEASPVGAREICSTKSTNPTNVMTVLWSYEANSAASNLFHSAKEPR